jgi:Intracellular proteinase inhibitor
MFTNSRASMISRLVLLGAVGLVTMGAQSSCSSGDGTLSINQPGPGTGTNTGPTFATTLTLKDSSGKITSRFSAGELITIELSILNRTNAPIHVRFPTMGGNQDFYVYTQGTDDAQWEWLANKLFATVVTETTFEPGVRQVVATTTWNQVRLDGVMLPPGSYEANSQWFAIQGQGLTEDDTRSPRVRFMVN